MRVFLIAICGYAVASLAQMNPTGMPGGLANFKLVEPAPEQPGDRAMSCKQIAREMGEIMNRRNMMKAVAGSKAKICRSTKEMDKQGQEKLALQKAQMPALAVAGTVGGPAAQAIVDKTAAETLALEAKQQPGRQRAAVDLNAGVGDMLGVMNDPRLMRLSMLAMNQSCAETMAPPPPPSVPVSDGCDAVADAPNVPNRKGIAGKPRVPDVPEVALPSGPADPFVKKGAATPRPAGTDPFAR